MRMKKKVSQKVKASSPKSKTNKPIKPSRVKAPAVAAPVRKPVPAKPDPAYSQAVQNYEAGLKALQERKYEKAKGHLEKASASSFRELADRARQHLRVCEQHLAKAGNSFKSAEEHYDYAVSMMNSGDYETAKAHFERILKQSPKADHVVYGLALLHALSGRVEESLTHLRKAIELNPSNRFQARNESDFGKMADDPRFTEMVYPEG